MDRTVTVDMDFRGIKEGGVVKIVEGGSPVIVEKIGPRKLITLICLDPVEGLYRRSYHIDSDGNLTNYGNIFWEPMDMGSPEAERYLKLIMGKQ